MHNDFTLFYRKVPSGRRVVYYYAYTNEGKRIGPWTTGEATKTKARNYCNLLNKQGKLLPQAVGIPTFAEYAVSFWDWENSPYLNDRRKRRDLTQHYADKNRNVAINTLVPYFGNLTLDCITSEDIDTWLDTMIKEGYKNSTTNSYFGTLQTMMKWAAKKRIIERDPFLDVQRLINNRKDKQIITPQEFKKMFVHNWRKVWNNDLLVYAANKLAALTGMRCCEVLGLKGEFVFDKHIFLCAQFDKYGYRATKAKTKHNIPLAEGMIDELKKLKGINGDGFIFSLDGGGTPIDRKTMYNGLQKAFHQIGINDEEIKKRGLNIHAWRHFANTELQKGGLSIQKVQAVIGHKSIQQTDRYTHFNPLEFLEVTKVQEDLLKADTNRPNETKSGSSALTLVKLKKADRAVKVS